MKTFLAPALSLALGFTLTASPASAAMDTSPRTNASAECANPAWTSAKPDAMWSSGGYIVHNNMWNAAKYGISQRLSACSPGNWSVTTRVGNEDKAVKAYPNTHVDYRNWNTNTEPKLDSFKTITSSFSTRTPELGTYNWGYDIWLNGVPGDREIMVWTDNRGQVPKGRRVVSGVRLSGHSWDLWETDDHSYQAFVPRTRITQGSVNLKSMLTYLVRRGSIQQNATLGQICFGVEIVSTDGQEAKFDLHSFEVTATRR